MWIPYLRAWLWGSKGVRRLSTQQATERYKNEDIINIIFKLKEQTFQYQEQESSFLLKH